MAYPPKNYEDEIKQRIFEIEIQRTKNYSRDSGLSRNDYLSGYYPDLMHFNIPSLKRHIDMQCDKCGYMLGDGLRKYCESCNMNYCERHEFKNCYKCQKILKEIEDSREDIDKKSDHNTRYDTHYIKYHIKDNKELAEIMNESKATRIFDDPVATLEGDIIIQ